jgi:hypothetical protein
VISFILLLVFNEKPLPANALKEKRSNPGKSPNASFDYSTSEGMQKPELRRFGGADKNSTMVDTAEEENWVISQQKKSRE